MKTPNEMRTVDVLRAIAADKMDPGSGIRELLADYFAEVDADRVGDTQVELLRKERDIHAEDSRRLVTRCDQLETEVAVLKERNDRLHAELNTRGRELEERAEQARLLKAAVAEKGARLQEWEKKGREANQAIDSLTAQKATLQAERAEIVAENATLRKEAALRAGVERLRRDYVPRSDLQRVSSIEQQFATLNRRWQEQIEPAVQGFTRRLDEIERRHVELANRVSELEDPEPEEEEDLGTAVGALVDYGAQRMTHRQLRAVLKHLRDEEARRGR